MELEVNSLLTPSLKDCTGCESNSMVQNKKLIMSTLPSPWEQRPLAQIKEVVIEPFS